MVRLAALPVLFSALTVASAAEPTRAVIRKVDEEKGTVSFDIGPRIVIYPRSRLIISPLPPALDFEAGETVELTGESGFVLVRRPERITELRREELKKLPKEVQKAILKTTDYTLRNSELQRAELKPATMRSGEIGRMSARYRVLQVIDEATMLLALGETVRHTFLVEGVSTKDLADDRVITLSDLFEVKGTRQYRAVSGATRTVMAVTPWKDPKTPSPEEAAELPRFLREFDMRLATEIKDQKESLTRAAAARTTEAKQKVADAWAAGKPARDEAAARLRLKSAEGSLKEGKVDEAAKLLDKLMRDFPKTKAAEKAKEMLRDLKKGK